MGEILIKVHESYRWVVAVCDTDVFGRKLIDSGVGSRVSVAGDKKPNRVLDLSGQFFDGEKMSVEDARGEILRCLGEDATFNFVGEKSVGLAKEMGIVRDEGIMKVDNIPIALVLL